MPKFEWKLSQLKGRNVLTLVIITDPTVNYTCKKKFGNNNLALTTFIWCANAVLETKKELSSQQALK
jgi:hypothetical protein